MALKRLICLLFVVGAISNSIQPIESISLTTAAPTSPTTTATTTSPTTTATTTSPTTTATTTSPTTTATTTSATTTTATTTSATTTTATTTSATTTEPGVCASNPCGGGSTCHERANKTYVCLCLAGDYYNRNLSQCVLGKAFPGTIAYKAEYKDAMENPTSGEFKMVADEIVSELDKVFATTPDKKYHGSTVTKLSKPPPASTKATGGGVIATVEIQFDKDSPVNAEDVENAAGRVGTFQPTKLCDRNPCDVTAQCSEKDGLFTCKCVDKYVPTEFSDRLCVACPKNEKAVDDTCEPCGFGYSGFNCEDNWQLILVIVGSVLGGLLLVTIILLPVVAVTTKKKSKKGKATDYAKPNPNPAPAKLPQITNGSAVPRPAPVQATPAGGRPGFGGNAVPRIPRATTNESWERSNLEMVPSNSQQNLIPAGRNARRFDDQDDLNPYSRPIKPQNNPYAMGRPQVNPYASSQGNSNPYYRNDEARRF